MGPSYEDTWGQRGAAGSPAGKRPPRHFSGLCRRSLPHRLPGLPHRRRGLNLPCHPLSPCSGEVLPLPGSQTRTAVMPSARGSALLPVTSVVWFCSEPQRSQLGPHRRRSAHLPQHTQADVWAHTTHTLMWTRVATPAHGLPARGAAQGGQVQAGGLRGGARAARGLRVKGESTRGGPREGGDGELLGERLSAAARPGSAWAFLGEPPASLKAQALFQESSRLPLPLPRAQGHSLPFCSAASGAGASPAAHEVWGPVSPPH